MKELFGTLTKKMDMGIAFAGIVLIAGCSFHSNQWEAMKRLLKPSEVVMQDRWFLSGPIAQTRVYPVQVSDAIIFTDGKGIFLKFDGWHFVEIRGFRDRYSEIISKNPVVIVFDYFVTDRFSKKGAERESLAIQKPMFSSASKRIVYEVNCEAWQQAPATDGKLLSQSCVFDSQHAFSNSIWLDQSGNIRAMESVLGPGKAKIRLEMREL